MGASNFTYAEASWTQALLQTQALQIGRKKLTTNLQLAKKSKNLLPAGRPPARRHHFVSPGDIISESAGDIVGICSRP
jgi:hypothetical protein